MIVILGALFFLYQFIVRIFFAFTIEDIIGIYNINYNFIGTIAGMYYTGYALSNLSTAVLFERFNFLKITTIGSTLITLGLLPFSMNCNPIFLIIGRITIGIGSGMAMPFFMKAIFTLHSKENHEFLINSVLMFSTFMLAASIYILKPIYNVAFGYHDFIHILIFSGLIQTGILITTCFSNYANTNQNGEKIETNNLLKFFINHKILILGIIGGLFVGTLEGFADLWSIYFFKDAYNIHNSEITMSIFWIMLSVSGFILRFIRVKLDLPNSTFLILIGLVKIAMFMLFFYTSYHNTKLSLETITPVSYTHLTLPTTMLV